MSFWRCPHCENVTIGETPTRCLRCGRENADAARARFLASAGVHPPAPPPRPALAPPPEMPEDEYLRRLAANGARQLVVLHVACGGYLSLFHTYVTAPAAEADDDRIVLRLHITADVAPYERNPCRCPIRLRPPPTSPLLARTLLEEAAWDARTAERYTMRTGLPFLTWP